MSGLLDHPYAFLTSCFVIACLSIYQARSSLATKHDESPLERKYRSAAIEGLHELPDIRVSPPETDLSVIIPAFNETLRLPTMLDSTLGHLNKQTTQKRSCEILVVDDGSDDGTPELALEYARKHSQWDIRVVSLSRNVGKGGAVRHGMLHSRGCRLLMVDADGASRFDDLELLWKEMDRLEPSHKSAVVIGSRAHLVNTEAVVKRSFLRNMAMRALHLTLRLVGVGHIRDTQCGFKLFTREAAKRIFPFQHLKGWIFDVEILMLAKHQSIIVTEIPISWTEVPESKLRVARDSILMFRDLVMLRIYYSLGLWTAPKQM